jgi:hypothetical protein
MTGCAWPNWYYTDTGKMTPMLSYAANALDHVVVGCVGNLCTSDALPEDAGRD